jgi:hypothetical protein
MPAVNRQDAIEERRSGASGWTGCEESVCSVCSVRRTSWLCETTVVGLRGRPTENITCVHAEGSVATRRVQCRNGEEHSGAGGDALMADKKATGAQPLDPRAMVAAGVEWRGRVQDCTVESICT